MPSTPKIEKILNDINEKAKIDEGKTEDQLFKEKVERVTKHLLRIKKMMIFFSNLYLIFTVFGIFMIYASIIQKSYFITCLMCMYFVWSLRNLLDTYFTIRLYGSEVKIHEMATDKRSED